MNINFSENTNNVMDKSKLPGLWHALLLTLIGLLISVLVGTLVNLSTKYIPSLQPWVNFINYNLTFIPLVFVGKYIFNIQQFDQNKTSPLIYLAIIPAIFGMSVIAESLASLIPMSDYFAKLFEQMIQINAIGYLTIAISAPILEELIFRGVILKGFLRKYSERNAILLSAFIFGAFHLNPWQFIPAFLIGAAIGWLYVKTKSIWPGIFIHWVNNSAGFYFVYKVGDIHASYPQLMGSKVQYIMLWIASLVICIATYFYLNNYFKKHETISNT